jgi:hypothetical protein
MNTIDLLIIKNGEHYIRHKENDYISCKLDKASVFPMEQVEAVKHHLDKLQTKGFNQVSVRKLILTEEPFNIENIGGN